MINIKLDVSELEQASKYVAKLGDRLGDAVERHLKIEGPAMEREVKEELSKGGRLSGRGPRGGKLAAHSAPGEPPYLQTGRLRSSIGYLIEIERYASGQLRNFSLILGAIRSMAAGQVQYAEGLELGRSNMAPRPYLMPVVMRHLSGWGSGLKAAITEISDDR